MIEAAEKWLYAQRQQVLPAAYEVHPERFVRETPTPPELPQKMWISEPPSNQIAVPPPAPAQPGAQAVSRVPAGQASEAIP